MVFLIILSTTLEVSTLSGLSFPSARSFTGNILQVWGLPPQLGCSLLRTPSMTAWSPSCPNTWDLLFAVGVGAYSPTSSKLPLCCQWLWLFGSTWLLPHLVFEDSHFEGTSTSSLPRAHMDVRNGCSHFLHRHYRLLALTWICRFAFQLKHSAF